MKSLLMIVAFTALATGSASAQHANRGAKVGKTGFIVNVNAFARCPSGDFSNSNRRMIAVQADFTGVATDSTASVNKIFLRSGEDYRVEDGNACDQNGAYFHLPVTSMNCRHSCGSATVPPAFTEYEVRARVVGKPNSRVAVTSCSEMVSVDPVTGLGTPTTLCSIGDRNVWVGARAPAGQAQVHWENVSTQLLTVCVDTSGDGLCDDRLGLFDSVGEGYWWSWDTAGRPHVQLVFFPVPPGGDGGGSN